MPRCGCAGSSCTCLVTGGDGITVEGAGTADNPYVIAVEAADIGGTIQFVDSPTVDFTVTGQGTVAAPYQVTAAATLALDDLTDVDAPTPTTDYVLGWNGTAWVPVPPATVEPGAISTVDPITGDGTAGNPIGLDLTTDTSLKGSGTVADPLGLTAPAAAGEVTVSQVANGVAKGALVTFPAGRFSNAPRMVASPVTSDPFQRQATASATAETAGTVYVNQQTGTTRDVRANWIAMEEG